MDTWWRHSKDDVEPDVRKDAPGGRCCVNKCVFNLSHFTVWNDVIADPRDDKEVESSRSNYRSGPEMSGLEALPNDFNDGEQDFWCGWSKDHQTKICYRLVPDFDFDNFNLTRHFVNYLDFFLLKSIHIVISTLPQSFSIKTFVI